MQHTVCPKKPGKGPLLTNREGIGLWALTTFQGAGLALPAYLALWISCGELSEEQWPRLPLGLSAPGAVTKNNRGHSSVSSDARQRKCQNLQAISAAMCFSPLHVHPTAPLSWKDPPRDTHLRRPMTESAGTLAEDSLLDVSGRVDQVTR